MRTIQSTNQQILDDLRRAHRRKQAQARMLRPIRVIDALLADLEELHLAGRKRVPETMDERLAAVAAELPAHYREELRSRITILHLMDRLYDIQDELLLRKQATPPGKRRDDGGGGDGLLSRAS